MQQRPVRVSGLGKYNAEAAYVIYRNGRQSGGNMSDLLKGEARRGIGSFKAHCSGSVGPSQSVWLMCVSHGSEIGSGARKKTGRLFFIGPPSGRNDPEYGLSTMIRKPMMGPPSGKGGPKVLLASQRTGGGGRRKEVGTESMGTGARHAWRIAGWS